MDDTLRTKLDDLQERVIDAMQAVGALLEAETRTPQEVDQIVATVEALGAEYQDLVSAAPEIEQARIDRSWGRRVTDLRRQASKLPQKSAGTAVAEAADAGIPFLTTARFDYTPNSPPPRTLGDVRREDGPRAGGDVEAWCGPCGGLREHTIVAIVDGKPKSVICQSCGNKHGYRTTPARAKSERGQSAAPAQRAAAADPEARRREQVRTALIKELTAASDVRTFSKRERYKVGEIIEHPQYGRGKIENILKGSMLVRFRDGLKSVSMI
jgi:hypothetical protein